MKYLFSTIVLLFTFNSFAQFGVSANYTSGKATASGDGISVDSDAQNIIGLGVFYDTEISESVDIQPLIELSIGEKVEGESNNSLSFGLNLQFYPSTEKRNFFIGPTLFYGLTLEDVDTSYSKKGGFYGGIQVGVDITDRFSSLVGYSTTLTDFSNIDGIKIGANTFGLTLQYKFGDRNTESN